MSSPLGVDPIRDASREFEAVLDRLEIAVTGHGPEYGPLENQADLAIVRRFVNGGVWDCLDHAQQRRYAARLAYLQRKGQGQTT